MLEGSSMIKGYWLTIYEWGILIMGFGFLLSSLSTQTSFHNLTLCIYILCIHENPNSSEYLYARMRKTPDQKAALSLLGWM